jgi:formylglycine-generating enzyme required for sulfatase activity
MKLQACGICILIELSLIGTLVLEKDNDAAITAMMIGGRCGALNKKEASTAAQMLAKIESTYPSIVTELRDNQESLSINLGNSVKLEMVRIPPGTFTIGSPEDELGRFHDEDQRDVVIGKAFYLGKYEVTQEQYKQIMNHNPSWFSPDGKGREKVQGQDTRRFPVEMVTREDATEFCRKLTVRAARCQTYRLPKETEWEYACRAGASSYTVFHSSNSLSSSQANFNGERPYGGAAKDKYLERTTMVGSYRPNAWGLYDMHGNVAEWCEDTYEGDRHGVLRGGCWFFPGSGCRSAFHVRDTRTLRNNMAGFRLVMVPSEE